MEAPAPSSAAVADAPGSGEADEAGGSEGGPKKVAASLRFALASVNGAGDVRVELGKVHVIHVWATFCAPCKRSLPALQALADRHGPSGLRVLGIAADDAEDATNVEAFVREAHVTFPVGHDVDGSALKLLMPPTMPTTVIVDRKGQIVEQRSGFAQGEEVALEKAIQALL